MIEKKDDKNISIKVYICIVYAIIDKEHFATLELPRASRVRVSVVLQGSSFGHQGGGDFEDAQEKHGGTQRQTGGTSTHGGGRCARYSIDLRMMRTVEKWIDQGSDLSVRTLL